MSHRDTIAKNIKSLRTAKHLKREELSLAVGFDNSYISKLEKGKVNITIDRLAKLAKFLDVEVYKLLKNG